ncbi:MAG: hypothetical protein LC135_00810 [Phycisphaerae bacterium]|nr:hypothetical protein [Phycisphaerae bacterium]MCZ2398391.1 hypothetical protein [Phycisphaerae bacterium]
MHRSCRLLALHLVGVSVLGAAVAPAGGLSRAPEPVILRGEHLPVLLGVEPGRIVAFAWSGGWMQVPVQIDERKVVDYGVVYNLGVAGLAAENYADPATYCGADDDAEFDANDELALMSSDAAPRAPAGAPLPAGVLAGPAIELRLNDPLDGGLAYVYLFTSDGSLPPDAGANYVAYTFNLLAGPYIPNYNTLAGPNPEDSTATTAAYQVHFSDRWVRDELNITAGGATGVDILDRHKALFAPGDCSRTEDTFSSGVGAFFCNIDGPVRGIRSYMGANSGVLTQREHHFYAEREDVSTYLRVHAISGIMDLFDYSPAAIGMIYQHSLAAAPMTIDGVPDALTPGPFGWELVTGPQGSLIMAVAFDTDIPGFAYTSYYSDSVTPPHPQCTGDAFELGLSGVWINQPIPNTDPLLVPLYHLTGRRTILYEPPGRTPADAAERAGELAAPLAVVVNAWPPRCVADLTDDGRTDQADLGLLLAAFGSCPGDASYNPLAGRLGGDDCVTQADLGVLLSDFGCGVD